MRLFAVIMTAIVGAVLAACSSTPPNPNPRAGDELKMANVDLPRYMGRWYIIANIPYFAERDFVGSYAQWTLRDDGKIRDEFFGHKMSFYEPVTHHEFVDSVVAGTNNAKWSVRIFWPIYVTQLTLYVDPDYQYTILGYPGKKLGWIFARTPTIDEAKYQELLARLDAMGYDTTQFRRVPQLQDQIGTAGFQSPGDK
ncbi:MAG: lipocalin [Verrucomicrobiaceae bacterium]|nr:lipocalin [Verrucomicrobiaceae bacterium]